jgi:hypothetical protein
MSEMTQKPLRVSVGDSLSTKADEHDLFPKTRAFGNKALLQELQSATTAFVRAKQALLDAQATKVPTSDQK